ncbi:chalcone isomerase family protein [Vibrio aestuarianus]|uniref:chalcone isomerase family protein n=1 Tax=Vibrio aestuarianus TaxID=28171 RepID=UPI00237C7A0F|nr:chalcone isomerase family protein [Vibrio aestuarianus]MDE1325354.1 chalcone isomerase family protein [Vibrio aestuarianus]
MFSLKTKRYLVAITLQCIITSASAATSQASTPSWNSWPVVGQATLSWLWLDIYSSQLRSPLGVYQQSDDVSPHPIALEIRYQRDISQPKLLKATAEQWTKLGYSDSQVQSWITQLQTIFPDVSDGQRLVYISDGRLGQFVFIPVTGAEQQIGEIDDEALNDAFLSIWLSPNSEYPKLRNQLIGMNR